MGLCLFRLCSHELHSCGFAVSRPRVYLLSSDCVPGTSRAKGIRFLQAECGSWAAVLTDMVSRPSLLVTALPGCSQHHTHTHTHRRRGGSASLQCHLTTLSFVLSQNSELPLQPLCHIRGLCVGVSTGHKLPSCVCGAPVDPSCPFPNSRGDARCPLSTVSLSGQLSLGSRE